MKALFGLILLVVLVATATTAATAEEKFIYATTAREMGVGQSIPIFDYESFQLYKEKETTPVPYKTFIEENGIIWRGYPMDIFTGTYTTSSCHLRVAILIGTKKMLIGGIMGAHCAKPQPVIMSLFLWRLEPKKELTLLDFTMMAPKKQNDRREFLSTTWASLKK